MWGEKSVYARYHNLNWRLCQNQTENYFCGYRNIIFTLNLNLMMLFLSIFYRFILWDTRNKIEKQLKLGFITARTISISVVCVNPSQGSLHS